MDFLASGALNLDLIFQVKDMALLGLDNRFQPGRELVLSMDAGNDFLKLLEKKAALLGKTGGGSAANTLSALAAFGYSCGFIGQVGNDEEGDIILKEMEGIDCSLVKRKGQSSKCIIVMDEKSRDRFMAVVPGDFDAQIPPALKEAAKELTCFHFSSIAHKKGPDFQKNILNCLPDSCLVSFDPGEVYAELGFKPLRNLFAKTHILFITNHEFKNIWPDSEEKSSLTHLNPTLPDSFIMQQPFFETPLPIMIQKVGKSGVKIFAKETDLHFPVKRLVHPVDNTGAGDALDAGVLHGILAGLSLSDAINCAMELAAFSMNYSGKSWIKKLNEMKQDVKADCNFTQAQ